MISLLICYFINELQINGIAVFPFQWRWNAANFRCNFCDSKQVTILSLLNTLHFYGSNVLQMRNILSRKTYMLVLLYIFHWYLSFSFTVTLGFNCNKRLTTLLTGMSPLPPKSLCLSTIFHWRLGISPNTELIDDYVIDWSIYHSTFFWNYKLQINRIFLFPYSPAVESLEAGAEELMNR